MRSCRRAPGPAHGARPRAAQRGGVCGDDVGALFGLLWLAVDQFLAGDPRATARSASCASEPRPSAAGDRLHRRRDRRHAAIRAGHLDDAESAAHECFELGVDVGEADATGYYGAHLITIRWLQDRDGELLDLARDIASASMLIVPEFAYRAAVAPLAARVGRHDEAAVVLAALADTGWRRCPGRARG